MLGGRSVHGVDCASFLLETARIMGAIGSWKPAPYGERQLRDPQFLRKHLARFCDLVEQAEIGDILLIKLGPFESHCALKSTDQHMIEVDRQSGCVEVTIKDSKKRRIIEIYRPRFYT